VRFSFRFFSQFSPSLRHRFQYTSIARGLYLFKQAIAFVSERAILSCWVNAGQRWTRPDGYLFATWEKLRPNERKGQSDLVYVQCLLAAQAK
jgi:hypothetical protein